MLPRIILCQIACRHLCPNVFESSTKSRVYIVANFPLLRIQTVWIEFLIYLSIIFVNLRFLKKWLHFVKHINIFTIRRVEESYFFGIFLGVTIRIHIYNVYIYIIIYLCKIAYTYITLPYLTLHCMFFLIVLAFLFMVQIRLQPS